MATANMKEKREVHRTREDERGEEKGENAIEIEAQRWFSKYERFIQHSEKRRMKSKKKDKKKDSGGDDGSKLRKCTLAH